ncbi:MAG: bifunctional diaminohydroxyphosphoribosylaminopyrimidine deaminase/5-amino-6-(5-phosphoribosylamino)uracil reductase RibD [Bacteroidota bacterium]
MTTDELYMQRCLELASNGRGNVAPNPMVGCVIVCDDRIIGEGFHIKFGGPHAEVHAIASVKNKELLKKSTLYVNLEPCSHFGKTPPCTHLIIKSGIPKVVVGMIDPFAEVNGNGLAMLKRADVEVVTEVLLEQCLELNQRFITFHKENRPYIILKWAQTRDAFIDKDRNAPEPHINWITNEHTRMLVHRWRAEEQAIITGTNTIRLDNPQLTVRDWTGSNPLRLVIDKNLQISAHAKVFSEDAKTMVFNAAKNEVVGHIEFVKLNFAVNIIPQILALLHQRNIQSLIVEGGRMLLQSFIDANLWDEARVFSGNLFFFGGTRAPQIHGTMASSINYGEDNLTIINPKR